MDPTIEKDPDSVERPRGDRSRPRIPGATYRLQFCRSFTFRDAQAIVDYLFDLGISDCYASPIFKPCHEDSHGYDVCDHHQLNPSLGGAEGFEAFSAQLRRRGMGLILDVVPNHMGISGAQNRWWMDVLENGPSSTFSSYFDIDWQPVNPDLKNKVLLPILEDQYGKVLESGKLHLAMEEGGFCIFYYQAKLPVAPRSYNQILESELPALTEALGLRHGDVQEYQSIITAIGYLPLRTESDPKKLEERNREKEVVKRRIAALCQKSPEVRQAIDRAIRTFNGTVGDPNSFDRLDGLINEQAYRPAFWRVASDEINYRRFFDINHLAAIRMEIPEVFQETHELIFRLLAEGKATGLRIDHPDGLWNPAAYFRQLQESYGRLLRKAESDGQRVEKGASEMGEDEGPSADGPQISMPFLPGSLYVIAEKILGHGEPLPEDWAVHGTTGYDFLNLLNALFVNPKSAKVFDRIYQHFVGDPIDFSHLVNSSKKMIMLVSLASEVNALAHSLESIAEKNRGYRDFTLNSLTFVIREIIAALPVYRTYITGEPAIVPRDQQYIEAAVEEAKRRNPRTAEAVFDFIRDTLLFRNLKDFSEDGRATLVRWVMQFQQITGPVMAKGLEDTAFYIYNRLVSLNEVGGHPEQFGVPVRTFHEGNLTRQQRWPHSMLATSTHDTKRSEDVRALINVLSEMSAEWRAVTSRWSRLNASKKGVVDGKPAPDRNDEYLLYQTLTGVWPGETMTLEEFRGFRERILAYMRKATMEAKVHTSWINPNEEYEAAVRSFILRVMDGRRKNRFLDDLKIFQKRVAFFGQFNSLSQVLLKLTAPGVPDLYQGTELWDFSLVDPDNRRLVDYGKRLALLRGLGERIQAAGGNLVPVAQELLEQSQDGRIKLFLIYRTLNFRRHHPALFAHGPYLPLETVGMKSDHICAFARLWEEEAIIAVVPRLVVGLTGGVERPPLGEEIWKDTFLLLPPEIPSVVYKDLYTGEEMQVEKHEGGWGFRTASIFRHFPVALLYREGR